MGGPARWGEKTVDSWLDLPLRFAPPGSSFTNGRGTHVMYFPEHVYSPSGCFQADREALSENVVCMLCVFVKVFVVPATRMSMADPSRSVASTRPSAMRIATDRPLQRTRNDKLFHFGGSFGSIASVWPCMSRPAKPKITAPQSEPRLAMRTPPAPLGSRSRSRDAVSRR